MITELSLQNFKCFENKQTFKLSSINLLTGINGRGKSTVLQSLLLLSQSYISKRTLQSLLINGDWISLGTFDDIKCSRSDSDVLEISLKVNGTKGEKDKDIELFYARTSTSNRVAQLTKLLVDGADMLAENSTSHGDVDSPVKTLLPLSEYPFFSVFNRFYYISADRIGPVKYVERKDFSDVSTGVKGENLINLLSDQGLKLEVNSALCCHKGDHKLLGQTRQWLSYVLNGANVEVNNDPKSFILDMRLDSNNDGSGYMPINVGFGYSYILPLIVTGLVAKKDDVVIVENIEAHLHPRAQARLTEFFVKLAESGVQVFIESHSEHVLNTLRLCALKDDFSIQAKDISIVYFDDDFSVTSIDVKDNGDLSVWPNGFFDQQEMDLAKLFTLSRKK